MRDAVTEYIKGAAKQAAAVSEVTHVSSGTWTPTLTGFSVGPTVSVYRYTLIGKLCTLVVTAGGGTSNATGFTVSLPFTAATISGHVWTAAIVAINSGAQLTTPGLAAITSGGAVVTLYSNYAGAAWTASGTKAADFTIVYEIA